MRLEGKAVDMETSIPIVIVNTQDAKELGVNPMDRLIIERKGEEHTGIIDTTKHLVEEGELGLTSELTDLEGELNVSVAERPKSVDYIKKKLENKELDREEIEAVIQDINKNMISDIELGSWVAGVYSIGMNMEESKYLTQAMIDVGERLEWDYDIIADKHSIGGVPGNRVTPIVVSIVASTGLKVPKTSSRAITSPSGTADTMEVFCNVEFDLGGIKEIVHETGGCMVWGGSVNLSPTDDKIIRAENPLSLDPESQVLASVLSKKKSAGSTHVVIDIPYGENSKVDDIKEAEDLGEKFKELGEELGMKVECAITRGDQPIGKGIGPNLEAIDVLKVLKGGKPKDLRIKSIRLADMLLKICGKKQRAEEILDTGRALEKFWEIIEAQGGERTSEEEINVGSFTKVVEAHRSGHITSIDNKIISNIARRAGAPNDVGAGVYLHKKKGNYVEQGDEVFTIYAEKKEKLKSAMEVFEKRPAFIIKEKDEMLMEEL